MYFFKASDFRLNPVADFGNLIENILPLGLITRRLNSFDELLEFE